MLGRWRGLCRAGAAGLCRAAGASQPFAKKKRAAVLPPREDWNFCDIGATNVKETRLGEPVLGEPVLGRARTWASHQTRLGRAIKRGWGEPLSLEGVFQMAYILPERLLALVRPAFDLVLRRIRSLKRCVQA